MDRDTAGAAARAAGSRAAPLRAMLRRPTASCQSHSANRTPGRALNQCVPGAVFCTMETHALPSYSQRTATPRWLIVGFIAGVLAVPVFHQTALAVLHAL